VLGYSSLNDADSISTRKVPGGLVRTRYHLLVAREVVVRSTTMGHASGENSPVVTHGSWEVYFPAMPLGASREVNFVPCRLSM
jgi:hypothetical protein